MSGYPYLIGIALIQQEGRRLMPIGGKSIKESIPIDQFPRKEGELIALELLLRVVDRSDEGAIKKANEGKSILLLRLPIELVQEALPQLKAKWIKDGNSELFLSELVNMSDNVWTIQFIKGSGIVSSSIKEKL